LSCRSGDPLQFYQGKVAGIDSEIPKTGVKKGVTLMEAGKYLEVISVFDEAIAMNPDDGEARYFRDLAHKKIEESISIFPQSIDKQTN